MTLEEIYRQVTTLADYAPSPAVDSLFSALVSKAIDPFGDEMLSKKQCGCLQKICAHAEYEMEKYWAQEIIAGNKTLNDFPYYGNYTDLTRLEWNALNSCADHTDHRVLFVGSGPLPMTAIILALNHGVHSTLIDNDPVAVALSQTLLQTLNLQHMIDVVCAEGSLFDTYEDFNVIFVAALAGSDASQKEKIFEYIQKKTSTHCHIIARSSWGKRKMLYPPLPKKVYRLFKPLIEISPYNEIVNSVVILKNDYR